MSGMPGSPLPGLAGVGNPPGSLGGKWEALGIGNDLFRTIAKYGSVFSPADARARHRRSR